MKFRAKRFISLAVVFMVVLTVLATRSLGAESTSESGETVAGNVNASGGAADPDDTSGGAVDPDDASGGAVGPDDASGGAVEPDDASGGAVEPDHASGGAIDPNPGESTALPTAHPTLSPSPKATNNPAENSATPTAPIDATEVPNAPTEAPTPSMTPTAPTDTPAVPTTPTDVTEVPSGPTNPTDVTEAPSAPTNPTDATDAPIGPTELPVTSALALKKDATLQLTDDNMLIGLIQEKNKVQEIVQQFETEDIVIKDQNEKVLESSDYVGTGAVVEAMDGDTVAASCHVVLIGDINGDGKVNGKDVSMLARYLVEKENLDVFQKAASEVWTADEDINGKDVSMLAQSLVGKATIASQAK